MRKLSQPLGGGEYSIFQADAHAVGVVNDARLQLAALAAAADSVELELAATTLFLFKEGFAKPWAETMRRKPEKSVGGRLAAAKKLYDKIRAIEVPQPFPDIPYILN